MRRLSVAESRRWSLWLTRRCLLTLGFLCICSLARAEDNVPPGYVEAVNQALSELEANNLPEALTEFQRAHAMYPNARSLRGMGMVEFDMRDYQSSARHLQEALSSSVKPLSAKMRTETETLLSRALRYLGEIRIVTDPANATILVDGSPAQPRSDGSLLLNVGGHTFEVRAAGRLTETRSLQVGGGDKRQISITLPMVAHEPEQQASSSAPSAPFAPPQEKSNSERVPVYKKWWLWTTVAVVVVGGATAAALVLTRDNGSKPQPVEGQNPVGVKLMSLSQF
jgi:hypothetical protein